MKYEYDCEKPTFASRFITFGRVNASARKIASGCFSRTSPITHSQNGKGLVCGLSTRKSFTPCAHQCRNMSRMANQIPGSASR